MYALLLLLSVSYWYCLPVITQGFFEYSEFRGYDFLLLALILLVVTRYYRTVRDFFRTDPPGRWLLRFSTWASVTFVATVVFAALRGNLMHILQGAVHLFHLWGFVIAYAAFRIFTKTRKQALVLLDAFLVVGAVEAVIIVLQALGRVPLLWSPLYAAYGERAFSATLGPNRVLPGHAMLLVLGVAFAYWRNALAVGSRRVIVAAAAAALSAAALGLSASRTAWVAALAFLLVLVVARRLRPGIIALVAILAVVVQTLMPVSVKEGIVQTYDWRITGHITRAEPDVYSKFESVASGRTDLWLGSLQTLVSRPWFIPFGAGFSNYRTSVGVGVAAHNEYITLIAEVGLVGIYFFLRWLAAAYRRTQNTRAGPTGPRTAVRLFQPQDFGTLVLAIGISLFACEILYTMTASFAFLGMFLFLAAMFSSPALIYGEQAVPEPAPARAPAVARGPHAGPVRPRPEVEPGL